jgi:very-short-patch-repair endonuclease
MADRGGYREGSGRSKSGYYKGIYCGSTYELCWVIHSLDHKIKFSRFETLLEHNGIKYYPDFLLDDKKTIIETKGYEKQESVDVKTAVAIHHGYDVIVLRKNDLKYAFDYVESTYETKLFHTLYDGYKPKYNYECGHCKNIFSRDYRLKTSDVFCSRICGGKFRKVNNDLNSHDRETANYVREFTKEQVLQIYNDDSVSLSSLALKYGTTKGNIWFIKQKKTYKWVHE